MYINITVTTCLDFFRCHEEFLIQLFVELVEDQTSLCGYQSGVRIGIFFISHIHDGLTLFIFSEEGELISCFEKRGEAPDEYSGISDFVIDGENIIILDRNQQKTITYDHLGNNISTFHLEYYAQAISPIVNNTFFLYNGFDTGHKLHRIRNWKEDSVFLEVNKVWRE